MVNIPKAKKVRSAPSPRLHVDVADVRAGIRSPLRGVFGFLLSFETHRGNTQTACLPFRVSLPSTSSSTRRAALRQSFCKKCKKHAPHKVTQYKTGKASLYAQGECSLFTG